MEYDPTSRVITAPPAVGGSLVEPSYSWSKPVGTAVLAAWIIFANLVIIIAMVTSEKRRKISFNLHVINLAIASLVMGCVVLPLHIDFDLNGQWGHADNVCRLWLISDLLVCTVSVLIVGMMVFDRFVIFSCTSVTQGCGQYVFAAFVFLTPWVLGCLFVIPVYLDGETGKGADSSISGSCYLSLTDTYSILLVLGGFFVPCVAAFGIMVAMTLTLFIRKENLNEMDWVEEIVDKGWQVLMSWLMHTVVMGMWLPINILFLIFFITDSTWPEYLEASMWIAYANAGVTPLVWMVMPRVRKSVSRLFCCCCKPKTPRRQLNFRSDYALEDDANVSMLEYRLKKSQV